MKTEDLDSLLEDYPECCLCGDLAKYRRVYDQNGKPAVSYWCDDCVRKAVDRFSSTWREI